MASSGPFTPLVAKGKDGEEIDISSWVQVYPCYISEDKRRSEGRKISKEDCAGCAWEQRKMTARVLDFARYRHDTALLLRLFRHPCSHWGHSRVLSGAVSAGLS